MIQYLIKYYTIYLLLMGFLDDKFVGKILEMKWKGWGQCDNVQCYMIASFICII